MSDGNFVSRWSRLKREAAQRPKPPAATEAIDARPSEAAEERADEASGKVAGEARQQEPAFDPATLPPIESIVASSDIRAFLQTGVPAELTKAALRRAWTSDPAIRDFIGIAENQWDFTDPTAIPGFGPLQAADNVGEMVAQAMGKLPDVREALGLSNDQPEDSGQAQDAPSALVPPDASESAIARSETSADVAAAQPAEPPRESDDGRSRRGHGRALPR